jgi:hypothetical protein
MNSPAGRMPASFHVRGVTMHIALTRRAKLWTRILFSGMTIIGVGGTTVTAAIRSGGIRRWWSSALQTPSVSPQPMDFHRVSPPPLPAQPAKQIYTSTRIPPIAPEYHPPIVATKRPPVQQDVPVPVSAVEAQSLPDVPIMPSGTPIFHMETTIHALGHQSASSAAPQRQSPPVATHAAAPTTQKSEPTKPPQTSDSQVKKKADAKPANAQDKPAPKPPVKPPPIKSVQRQAPQRSHH